MGDRTGSQYAQPSQTGSRLGMEGRERETDIDLRAGIRRLFLACLLFQAALVVADYVFNYLDVFDERAIRRIWNIAREQSIPSWFSSVLAQLLGATVLLIAILERKTRVAWATLAWILAGLFFFWVGIDDYAEIHERLGGALERLAGVDDDGAAEVVLFNPSFSWHTFIAPVYALFSLGILALVGHSFWRRRLLPYLVLGFGCWAVAQGIDFVEGLDAAEQLYDWGQETFAIERRYGVTHTVKVVEEMLETLGTTLLWIGFLHYLAGVLDGRRVRFRYGAD